MRILSVIFLLFGLIEQLAAISCYTCNELHFNCPVPLPFGEGDESNESQVSTPEYKPGSACMSEQTWDPRNNLKIILRGVDECEEIDEDNRRVHCCYSNLCNKELPTLSVNLLANDESSETSDTQRHFASLLSIVMTVALQYLL